MLQCNLTKGDESTFSILNVDRVFVRNWLLRYINDSNRLRPGSLHSFRIFKGGGGVV